ncbi:MAG: SpoIIE family protein phosphatase, partial [Bacteroidia bacterium]|nr:SpoIIE family protein phosphatase [Bacteroidia bacterium]
DANTEKRKKNLALFLSLGGLGLCAFVIWFVIRANKKVKLANKLVKEQKKHVEEQKAIIEEKHKDITDSIFYAQKIQESLIIPEAQLKKSLPESFVLYAPRDIVSGDFYWYGERDGFKILAVADCTGHGVPGAFMSLIGISSLNQVVLERGLTSPAKILDLLREKVIQSLNQNNEDSHRKDGMDISVIALKNKELIYAGANNPCIILRNKEIISLEANKQPVGFHEHATAFFEKKTELQKGDLIYLFTDGIVDQFGGEKGKKLKIKYFKEWLLECSTMEMPKQKEFIQNKLKDWKRNFDQTDDILITGVKC